MSEPKLRFWVNFLLTVSISLHLCEAIQSWLKQMAVSAATQNTHFSKLKMILAICMCIFIFKHHKNLVLQTDINLKRIYSNPVNSSKNIRRSQKLNQCIPQKFVFLKVHKSGSTFIAKILRNFARRNNFTELRSLPYPTWIGGYPGPFNSSFYPTELNKIDHMSQHAVWNLPEMAKTFSAPKNHKKIAILREPFSQFKSAYSYFYQRHFSDKSGNWFYNKRNGNPYFSSCAGEPVFTFMENREDVRLPEFIDGIMENGSRFTDMPFWFRFNNSQSHDFGRQGAILGQGVNKHLSVKNLLKQFDLILIMERMEESLVLLKTEICMDWEHDDFRSHKNSNKHKAVELSSVHEKFVRKNLINMDLELYQEAMKVFEKQVKKSGGKQLLVDDYSVIKNLNENLNPEPVLKMSKLRESTTNFWTHCIINI